METCGDCRESEVKNSTSRILGKNASILLDCG